MECGGWWGPIRVRPPGCRFLARHHPQETPASGHLRDTPVLYLRDGMDLHDLILREYRGPSSDCPYDVGKFPGAVFQNRIPPMFTGFLDEGTGPCRSWVCREMGGRPRPREVAAAPAWLPGRGVIGRGDKTAPNLRCEAIEQAVQEGSFFDEYGGAGGKSRFAGLSHDHILSLPLLLAAFWLLVRRH